MIGVHDIGVVSGPVVGSLPAEFLGHALGRLEQKGLDSGLKHVLDDAHGHPQEIVDRPHPHGVAPGEVFVVGDEVDPALGYGVEEEGHRRH